MKHAHTTALCGALALAQGCKHQPLSAEQEEIVEQSIDLSEQYVDKCMVQMVDAARKLPGPNGKYVSPEQMKQHIRQMAKMRRQFLKDGKYVVIDDADISEAAKKADASGYHRSHNDEIAIIKSTFDLVGQDGAHPDLGLFRIGSDVLSHEIGHVQSKFDDSEGHEHGHMPIVSHTAGTDTQTVYDKKDYPYTLSALGRLTYNFVERIHSHNDRVIDGVLMQDVITPEYIDGSNELLPTNYYTPAEYIQWMTMATGGAMSKDLAALQIDPDVMGEIAYNCLYSYQKQLDSETIELLTIIEEEEAKEQRETQQEMEQQRQPRNMRLR